MNQGIYEQLINGLTRKQLNELNLESYDIGTEALDIEEARKSLTIYRALVVREYKEDNNFTSPFIFLGEGSMSSTKAISR